MSKFYNLIQPFLIAQADCKKPKFLYLHISGV